MSFSTAVLTTELRSHLGLDEDDLPDPDALLLLNRAYWEILDIYPFREKEITVTFDTTAGTRTYTVPDCFDTLTLLSVLNPSDNKHYVLDRQSPFSHEDQRSDTTEEGDRGLPTHYVREGDFIRLQPTPDDTYVMTLKYLTSLRDLNISGPQNLTIPESWHETILYGAVYRGFLKLRDFTAAANFQAMHKSLLDRLIPVESAEESDSHRSGLEVLGRDYP